MIGCLYPRLQNYRKHNFACHAMHLESPDPGPVFVKLEELHIATARKPLIHQNQPVARYLHKKQPCMLWFMLVGLQHRTLSSKLSTDNQVIGNFCIPADSTNAFGDLSVHTNFRLLYSGLFTTRREIVRNSVVWNNHTIDCHGLMWAVIGTWSVMPVFNASVLNIHYLYILKYATTCNRECILAQKDISTKNLKTQTILYMLV